jgi:hypothetical protein
MGRALGLAVCFLLPVLRPQAPPGPRPGELDRLLAPLRSVGKEGAGNGEARAAWREAVRRGPEALPVLLAAWDEEDPVAANWLRTAVDAIAEREVRAGRPLPARRLEAFVRQTRHAGAARRLAYEWLTRADPSAPGRLLPGMLQDPSPELRRDAVALAIKDAQTLSERGDRPAATVAYRKALAATLDRDRADQIARQLETLGIEVDLASHFGFVRKWMLVGPFDNTGGAGFRQTFPPEKTIDLAGTYMGKGGATLRWTEHTTADPYGVVDLNKALGKHPGAVAYAFTAVRAPGERPVQIRVGSENAVQIFLNGRRIFAREEYHHGMRMDQHVAAGTLRAGRNEILVKVCQNEQTEDWAQSWSFQLRVTDTTGAKVPLDALDGKDRDRAAGGEGRP